MKACCMAHKTHANYSHCTEGHQCNHCTERHQCNYNQRTVCGGNSIVVKWLSDNSIACRGVDTG